MRRDPHIIGRIVVILLAGIFPCFAKGQTQASPNCRLRASPPPLATFGGPATVTPGQTELGIGVGGFAELLPSPCIHAGGTDWFVRWRRGVSNRIDLGFDVQVNDQTDSTLGATVKVAMRYRVKKGFRIEGGWERQTRGTAAV